MITEYVNEVNREEEYVEVMVPKSSRLDVFGGIFWIQKIRMKGPVAISYARSFGTFLFGNYFFFIFTNALSAFMGMELCA